MSQAEKLARLAARVKELEAGEAERARLLAQNESLLAVLRAVEWAGYDNGPECPACRGSKEAGHYPTCDLAAALAASSAPSKPSEQPSTAGATADAVASSERLFSDHDLVAAHMASQGPILAKAWLRFMEEVGRERRALVDMAYNSPQGRTPRWFQQRAERALVGSDTEPAVQRATPEVDPSPVAPGELEKLREALQPLVEACENEFGSQIEDWRDDDDVTSPPCGITFGMIRRAREALRAASPGPAMKRNPDWEPREITGIAPEPEEDEMDWTWHRSAELSRAESEAVEKLRTPPPGGWGSKEHHAIVRNAMMRALNAAGVPLPNYRVPPEWANEAGASPASTEEPT